MQISVLIGGADFFIFRLPERLFPARRPRYGGNEYVQISPRQKQNRRAKEDAGEKTPDGQDAGNEHARHEHARNAKGKAGPATKAGSAREDAGEKTPNGQYARNEYAGNAKGKAGSATSAGRTQESAGNDAPNGKHAGDEYAAISCVAVGETTGFARADGHEDARNANAGIFSLTVSQAGRIAEDGHEYAHARDVARGLARNITREDGHEYADAVAKPGRQTWGDGQHERHGGHAGQGIDEHGSNDGDVGRQRGSTRGFK